MKKNYAKFLLVVLMFCTSGQILNAQCTTPSPPSVSGGTIAGCVSSAAFTLTGTPSGTNVIGWYANSFGGNALSTNSVFTTPTLTSSTTFYVGQSNASTVVDAVGMPTYSRNVPAQETRGYYFTAPVDFIITGLRVPVAIGGTVSAISVVKLPATPPVYTNVTNTFSTLYLNQAITGTNIVSVNIPVYSGDIIGVLGERNDTSAYGPNTGNGYYTSSLGVSGPTLNLYRMGMLFNLAVQTPTNLWTETVNTIGIIEMYVKQSCNSTLTPVTVSIVPTPTVVVATPPVICANSSYTLSAAGANTFTWTGGPQTSTYVVSPSSTHVYSVQGSILSNCTSAISTVTVNVVSGLPVLTATASSNMVCSGNTLALSGGGAPTFTWAGGVNSVTDNVAFIPVSTQQYTLYGTNACGVGSTMITVTVNATPTLVTSSTPAAVCDGQTATLSVTGASTYSWAAASGPGPNLVITPTASGYYYVTGTSSAGCPATAQHGLIVNPNPTVTAVSSKTLVCSGGSVSITSSGADVYSWSSGSQTNTDLVFPSATSIYTVIGTYSLTQCSSTNTVQINVFSPPFAMSPNTTVCYGAALTLTADAGPGSSYLWNTGSPFGFLSITATTSAYYSVTVQSSTVGGLTCSNSGTVSVSLYPNPTVQIVPTRSLICKGEKTTLTATGGTAFVWAGQSPTTASIQVSPVALNTNSTVTYSVTVTDVNGCKGKATVDVKVKDCTGINEYENGNEAITVYPNPNNGNFTVQVKNDMRLTLINELGQAVKELSFTEENQFSQSVQGLSDGVYFIKGVNNNSVIQYKLVITK